MDSSRVYRWCSPAWLILVGIAVVVFGALLFGQPRTLTLAIGTVTANDQEKDGCMFAVGPHAMLVLHPKGEPCVLATEQIGATGTLLFVRD